MTLVGWTKLKPIVFGEGSTPCYVINCGIWRREGFKPVTTYAKATKTIRKKERKESKSAGFTKIGYVNLVKIVHTDIPPG